MRGMGRGSMHGFGVTTAEVRHMAHVKCMHGGWGRGSHHAGQRQGQEGLGAGGGLGWVG